MYNQKIISLFVTPQNAGVLKNATCSSQISDSVSGDVFRFYAKVEDGKIVEAKFKTFGGVVSIVASSIATTLITDKKIEELDSFNGKLILVELGNIPEHQYYLTTIIEEGIRKLLVDYNKKMKKEENKKTGKKNAK